MPIRFPQTDSLAAVGKTFDGRHPCPLCRKVVLVNRQEYVAAYNGEPTTPGYALLNLRAAVHPSSHWDLQLGRENAFDTRYADHLDGVNRVAGSDVAVGERIPGWGRSLHVRLTGHF